MQYTICKEQMQEVEAGAYLAYGICYGGKRIGDISTDEKSVLDLVHRMNEGGLSLMHLSDVLEDFLAE